MQADASQVADTVQGAQLGALERMPKWLICVPLALQWLWLSLRYRSTTLPSSANPHLTAGGLVGEGKQEYFAGMGPAARAAIACYCVVSTHCRPSNAELLQMLHDASLGFPVIAKPDLGLCGHGVRRVNDMQELRAYVDAFPENENLLLQEYLPQEGEAGIFYARMPGQMHGRLIGLALRQFPQVRGDGLRSIGALIAADPRAGRLLGSRLHECGLDLHTVPRQGEVLRLSTIGSTRVGGLYLDGAHSITPQLSAAVDAIARDMPSFHFGRFDVRYASLAQLRAGTGFTIMEINGAGSEAIQAWDPSIGLLDGLQMIFSKQRILFSIGHAMRRAGAKPIGLLALARLNRRQHQLIARYPPSN